MSEQERQWQQALDALVTGQPVDWGDLDAAGDESGAWRQLQHLQRIQTAMKATLHSHIEEVPADYLFRWGHLYALEKIGSGGFGDVFRCHDAALCRPVALKLLNQERIRSWQKNQFIEEARNMARVRSPHVLTIHGAAMHQGQVGFWCDYISGQSLDSVDVTADWDEAVRLMESLAMAVQAVHDSQLVHGDIKPANVMLSDQGRYVLMDFGGSLLGEEADWSAANWVGSPEYMAPELFGDQVKTPASDIYALGLLCVRQLSGASPFTASNWDHLSQQKQTPLSWPNTANHVPKHWQRLLLNLCDPDPNRRPTATQVAQSMAELKARPERLRKRNLRWAVMGLLLAGLLVSGWASWRIQTANTQLAAEKNSTEQANEFLFQMLNASRAMGQGREVRMADVIDASAEDIDSTLADSPASRAQLHLAVGKSYNSLRLNHKALPHLEQSWQLYKQLEGPQSVNAIKAQLELAVAHLQMSEVKTAKKLLSDAVELSVSGPEALHVLALLRLAMSQLMDDENQAAVDLLEPWLHITEPPINTINNNPRILLTTLSDAHYNLGQFDRALALAQKTEALLPLWPKVLPTQVMAVHNQIAKAAAQAGEIDLALAYFSRLVDESMVYYGEGNLEHIGSLVNYGGILSEHERYEESIMVLKQAFELAEQNLGKSHRTTIQAGMNYANAMTDNNMLGQAQTLMEALLPHAAETFGESHQIHLMLTYNLVELLHQQGRFAEAWPLTEHNAATAREHLGENHPLTWYILTNQATVAAGLGHLDEAWALFEEVDKRNGTDPPKVKDLYELSQRLQERVRGWEAGAQE